MSEHSAPDTVPSTQAAAERIFRTLERFLHVEALSGIVLMAAALAALIWANSPFAASYSRLWHAPVTFGFADYVVSRPLEFWINDGLMTVFFLLVGMEIRREIYEGALASARLAALPVAAALGGVVAPALVYLAVASEPAARAGWAVPTATDIAFAIGVLGLLGKSVPGAVRVFLLAIAIIDDIVAVIIIAVFYSGGLEPLGFLVAGTGVALVLALRRIGIASAHAYVVPAAVVWTGTLMTGAHPTLAGVLLGLLTPVSQRPARQGPLDAAARALRDLGSVHEGDPHALREPLTRLKHAQRDFMPPVVRLQMALHPWVAFGVMPLFALANAGVSLAGLDLAGNSSGIVLLGVAVALVIGKPAGIMLASWMAVRSGLCSLPEGVGWRGVLLAGCLAGIGFSMAIFIATLGFSDPILLAAAKTGVLAASVTAGVLGLLVARIGRGAPGRPNSATVPESPGRTDSRSSR